MKLSVPRAAGDAPPIRHGLPARPLWKGGGGHLDYCRMRGMAEHIEATKRAESVADMAEHVDATKDAASASRGAELD